MLLLTTLSKYCACPSPDGEGAAKHEFPTFVNVLTSILRAVELSMCESTFTTFYDRPFCPEKNKKITIYVQVNALQMYCDTIKKPTLLLRKCLWYRDVRREVYRRDFLSYILHGHVQCDLLQLTVLRNSKLRRTTI